MCIRVDLPEPEGPMIELKRPRSKPTDTPVRASTAASPSPKRRQRSVATTIGAPLWLIAGLGRAVAARRVLVGVRHHGQFALPAMRAGTPPSERLPRATPRPSQGSAAPGSCAARSRWSAAAVPRIGFGVIAPAWSP